MPGTARGDVEIWVHTTAPSRGQDDARYRALAQAYLDFEPAEIRRLDDESAEHTEEDPKMQVNSQHKKD